MSSGQDFNPGPQEYGAEFLTITTKSGSALMIESRKGWWEEGPVLFILCFVSCLYSEEPKDMYLQTTVVHKHGHS
jgi:hypothetical protein